MKISLAIILVVPFSVTSAWAAQSPGEVGKDRHIEVKNDRLQFMDEKGGLVWESSLGEEVGTLDISTGNLKSKRQRGELTHDAYMNMFALSDRGVKKVKLRIRRNAFIDKSRKTACHTTDETPVAEIGANGAEKIFSEPLPGTGEITCVNDRNEQLWGHRFPDGRHIAVVGEEQQPKISEDGKVYAVLTRESEGSKAQIYVFNEVGKELLRFPDDAHLEEFLSVNSPTISSNGRYLSLEAHHYPASGDKNINTIFFDVPSGKSWETKRYVVYEISGQGIAKVGNLWDRADKTRTIDVKEQLKK